LVPDATDAELGRIYGHSRALVYPSAYEGLGLPVAEAILSGLPSIVPKGSPMEHFLAGAGVVVDRLEPPVLADAMQALGGDRELWERCAAAAARGAEQFNWDRVAEATARALEI
jgi:glycosyltransferase involved in cell wall biosynthesis